MISYYNINADQEDSFRYKGHGKKKLLILITDERSDHLFNKLTEIIGAIKYNLKEDCFYSFNYQGQEPDFVINNLQVNDVIIFGSPTETDFLNLQLKPYAPKLLENKRIIYVESLGEILSTHSKKLKLWNLLQKLYLK